MAETNLKVADVNNYLMYDPLSPAVLREQGLLGDLPAEPHDPLAKWSASFRMWLAKGRAVKDHTAPSGNVLGLTTFKRAPLSELGVFSLVVDRYLPNEKDRLHHLHAEIVCREDALASPASWTMRSDFQKPDGTPDPAISRRETGSREKGAPAAASSFGLFEAVQRLPFGTPDAYEFTLLDELDLEKPGFRVRYHGAEDYPAGGAKLHWFQQVGWGLLPFDYWLDEQHRLLVAVHSPLVYIREDIATGSLPEILAGVVNGVNGN